MLDKTTIKYDPAKCQWIVNYFKDDDVFVVGGGPSLFDLNLFELLKNKRIIAINHSYRYCNPEILIFLDSRFRKEAVDNWKHDLYSMPFKIIAGPSSGMKTYGNCTVIQLAHRPTNNPASMYGRAQSGLVAINMCLIGQARNIYLLGFDFKFKEIKIGRKKKKTMGHFYSNDFKHSQDENERVYRRMTFAYDKYRVYKNIYNCNPDSLLNVFPKIKLEDVL